jgi:hypothetical protein
VETPIYSEFNITSNEKNNIARLRLLNITKARLSPVGNDKVY